jgi:hypothetical protein
MAALLPMACHQPRDTRSVHLPLAVGNRWVYSVQADSIQDTAVVKVVAEDDAGFDLSVCCAVGHVTQPDGLLRLRCRDSVLWLQAYESGTPRWLSILSDDQTQRCTHTLLLFREQSGSSFSSCPVGTVVAGSDTFADCLMLECVQDTSISSLWSGEDRVTTVRETYAPGVGLVRLAMTIEAITWFWTWEGTYYGSYTCEDSWTLRDYRLAGE